MGHPLDRDQTVSNEGECRRGPVEVGKIDLPLTFPNTLSFILEILLPIVELLGFGNRCRRAPWYILRTIHDQNYPTYTDSARSPYLVSNSDRCPPPPLDFNSSLFLMPVKYALSETVTYSPTAVRWSVPQSSFANS